MKAILGKNLVRLNYPLGDRLVEPHAYGTNTQGNELLRAFQVSGASDSGEHIGWKLFRVDRISSLTVLPQVFNDARPDYKRGDQAMTHQTFAEV